MPVQEIPVAEALAREPRINPGISRAFEVADAAVDAWKLLWGNARSAQEHGARILTYHWVTEILRDGDRTVGARGARRPRRRARCASRPPSSINAGGVWAGQIADMADCPGVTVVPGKGIMIAMNHRLVLHGGQPLRAARRRRHPGPDPHGLRHRHHRRRRPTAPTTSTIDHDEVQQMLDAGEVLVPGFRQARALHVWTGARPLFKRRARGERRTTPAT